MHTEKSQAKGIWIMLETRLIEFPALSIVPRVGISQAAPMRPMFDNFSYQKLIFIICHFIHFRHFMWHNVFFRMSFVFFFAAVQK